MDIHTPYSRIKKESTKAYGLTREKKHSKCNPLLLYSLPTYLLTLLVTNNVVYKEKMRIYFPDLVGFSVKKSKFKSHENF